MYLHDVEDIPSLITALAEMLSYERLAADTGILENDLKKLAQKKQSPSSSDVWRILRICNKRGFFDLLPEHGIAPVTYDLSSPFHLREAPIGFDTDPPVVPLRCERVKLAGYPIDFPLGLPASILAANSRWIEFYARRGFDILTYKTVRTQLKEGHSSPNWVFIKDPVEVEVGYAKPLVGPVGYWPEDLKTISMANSFGMPSLAPDWWQNDVRRAREIIREGHQVLIVSVVSSINNGELDAITDDFVTAARMAKDAGAQIVEANYSCPNVISDPVGEVYQSPESSAYISEALKHELGDTPLFVKIGYLDKKRLFRFAEKNAKFIDGIVAINTISASIVDENGKDTFSGRPTAGVSGWAIKRKAKEVAQNLVAARNETRKDQRDFAILGLGGVITKQDYDEFKMIGVTAVETCTGAFLNPNLGLQIRLDEEAAAKKARTPRLRVKGFRGRSWKMHYYIRLERPVL